MAGKLQPEDDLKALAAGNSGSLKEGRGQSCFLVTPTCTPTGVAQVSVSVQRRKEDVPSAPSLVTWGGRVLQDRVHEWMRPGRSDPRREQGRE